MTAPLRQDAPRDARDDARRSTEYGEGSGRATRAVQMTDGTGMPRSADTPQTTEVAALLREVARLVDEVEALVAGSPRPVGPSAPAIAVRQAAIVAAAHEEAAAVLAAAHATAARVLDRASRGEASPEDALPAVEAVVDLRDSAPEGAPLDESADESPAADPASPPRSTPPALPVDETPAPSDPVPVLDAGPDAEDADLRSSLAAAIEMARSLSERIEQLTRELHESSTS